MAMIETMAQNGPLRHRSHTGGDGKRATAQKARGPAFHHGVVLPPPPIGFAQKRDSPRRGVPNLFLVFGLFFLNFVFKNGVGKGLLW